MKKIQCEVCNSTHLVKEGDFFVCESCGMRYRLEEVKNMISGTVEEENGEKRLKDFYDKAYFYLSINQPQNAEVWFETISRNYPKEVNSFYELMKIDFEGRMGLDCKGKKFYEPLLLKTLKEEREIKYLDEVLVRSGGREKCINYLSEKFDDIKKNIEENIRELYPIEIGSREDKITIRFLSNDNDKGKTYEIPTNCGYHELVYATRLLNDAKINGKMKLLEDYLKQFINNYSDEIVDGLKNGKILHEGDYVGWNYRVCIGQDHDGNNDYYYEVDVDKLIRVLLEKSGYSIIRRDNYRKALAEDLYYDIDVIYWKNYLIFEEHYSSKYHGCRYQVYELNCDFHKELNNIRVPYETYKKIQNQKLIQMRKSENRCQYCGGYFYNKGFFTTKYVCRWCEREKDY